jgi:hypothetical protein
MRHPRNAVDRMLRVAIFIWVPPVLRRPNLSVALLSV